MKKPADKNKEVKQQRSRIAESIRKQLIEIREAKGMSKAKFARATGVSRSTIIRIEQNETSPNMESLGTICEALDLDVRIIENK